MPPADSGVGSDARRRVPRRGVGSDSGVGSGLSSARYSSVTQRESPLMRPRAKPGSHAGDDQLAPASTTASTLAFVARLVPEFSVGGPRCLVAALSRL